MNRTSLNRANSKRTFSRNHVERAFRIPRRFDPYRSDSKPKGMVQCSDCHAIQIKGRWLSEHQAKPEFTRMNRVHPFLAYASLPQRTCPACLQRKQHFAMGVVELHGHLSEEQLLSIFETFAHTERIARSRNDQERLLWTHTLPGITKVYVSLPELARQLGRMLQKTFKGQTRYIKTSEEPFLRVVWNAPAPAQLTRHKAVRHQLGQGRARGRRAFA